LGCDLELARPRPRALEIAQRYFTAAEAGWLARLDGPAREAAFVRIWCAKEAMLKAHGRGIAFGLHRLEFGERAGSLAPAGCRPAGPPREAAFGRISCAKEAMLKAHGRGIAFGPHRLEFGERAGTLALIDCDPALGTPSACTLHAFAPAPNYLATLAWHPLST